MLKKGWRKPGSILSAPSFQVFIDTNKIPLNRYFSKVNSPISLCLFLYKEFSRFIIFMILHWTLFSMLIHLLYWGAQNCIHYSRYGLTSAEWSSPAVDMFLQMHLNILLSFLGQGFLLGPSRCPLGPWVLFCKTASGLSGPHIHSCWICSLPHAGICSSSC